jgi:hypothetical protein
MKKWIVQDRYGNTIYFTEERWKHIFESRPELKPFFDKFLETIRTGRRKQDPLMPNEYITSGLMSYYQKTIISLLLLFSKSTLMSQ